MTRRHTTPVFVNVFLFGLVSFLQAVQVLILCSAVSAFIPYKTTDFVNKIFPVYLPEVRPEREMLLYRAFVLLALGAMAVWTIKHRRNMVSEGYWRRYIGYAGFCAAAVFIQLFFVFKVIVLGAPAWAKWGMYLSMPLAVLGHVFWPELQGMSQRVTETIKAAPWTHFPWALDAAFAALLVFLLWPAELNHVLGRMYVHDQFYHLDSMLMAPGWAHLNGLKLNLDITSEYSVGLPVVLSNILFTVKHFDYPSAVLLLIGLNLAYYVGLYLLLKRWLSSRGIAAAAVLLAVKLQLFHWGVAPLVWQFPSATPLRHLPDIIFFAMLWQYARTQLVQWVLGMAIVTGAALFWMLDVGAYLFAALTAALVLTRPRLLAAAVPAVLVSWGILLFTAQPVSIFSTDFWRNSSEFASMFLSGWGALPMSDGLKDKQYFAFIMGFAIPLVYAAGLLYHGQRAWKQKTPRDIFLTVITVYGLGFYHYFINRSAVTSYYAVCVPLIILISFWVKSAAGQLSLGWQRVAALMSAGVMLCVLMTSYLFTFYPNFLNFAGADYRQEAQYYRDHFGLKEDAGMIEGLTKPGERAAVVSSFETRLLMLAKRPPFFYYTPLMESSPMDDPQSRLTYLHTYARLKRTLAQINQGRPEYIFIEQKLLKLRDQEALARLLEEVGKNYMPARQGRYLAAFKRRPG